MNLVSCVVEKLSIYQLEQWAVACAHCLGLIMLMLLGRVVAGISFRCQVATLEKAPSNGSVQVQCLPGKLEGQSSAATQDTFHKFRFQFAANAMTFNLVRMEEEFLKGPDSRENPDHKNERLRC